MPCVKMGWVACLVLGVLAVAVPTSAQRALLLPANGEGALVERHGAEARDAVRTALTEARVELLDEATIRSELAASGNADCADTACAPDVIRALGVEMAAGVALWRDAGGVRVAVVLVDPEGHEVGGAAVTEGDVAVAAREALDEALARWSSRSGVQVRVVGGPEGASVTVDRDLWGTLPHEGSLTPGEHRFVVSAAGYQPERRTVELQLSSDVTELRFELARVARGGRTAHYVGASALGALGLGALAFVIAEAARAPQCVETSGAGDCAVAEVPATGALAAYGALGAGVVAGAVVWLVVAALGGDDAPVEVDARGASMRVKF